MKEVSYRQVQNYDTIVVPPTSPLPTYHPRDNSPTLYPRDNNTGPGVWSRHCLDMKMNMPWIIKATAIKDHGSSKY